MFDSTTQEIVNEVNAKLVLRNSINRTTLSIAIPTWPERLSFLLIPMMGGFFYSQKNSSAWEVLLSVLLFTTLFSLHWYVTAKLREKVEVLSRIVSSLDK